MNLFEIIQNRPHFSDHEFLGTICIKDKYGRIHQSESFKSRSERKVLTEMMITEYHEKLLFSNWTINITLE